MSEETTTPDATPGAIAHAEATGVDLTQVEGSGAGGKITKADVAAHAEASEPANGKAAEPDHYYPVKTGDTFDGIAAELNHKDGGQELMDASHGGPTNGELAAGHFNRLAGADGEATDEQGRLIRILAPKDVTTKTKLVEGQSLLLPKGW